MYVTDNHSKPCPLITYNSVLSEEHRLAISQYDVVFNAKKSQLIIKLII